jgi:outer membrane protein OmpA-like peptidoglycan-associated protein
MNILSYRILAILIVALTSLSKLSAQSASTERYGVFVGYNFNFHTADFRALPGVPNCCPKFESGSGGGFALGALYETAISRRFWLTFQANYSTLNATLNRQEYVPALRLSDDYYFPDAAINHRIKARLSSIGVAPVLTLNPVGGLRLHAGMELALLNGIQYDQIEEMSAEGLVFKENLKRTRNEFSGNLSQINKFQTSLMFGTSIELPLNRLRTMIIAPQAQFRIGLSNLSESVSWKANAFQIGIALKYAPKSEPTTTIEKPSIPQNTPPTVVETLPKQSPKSPIIPSVSFEVFGVSEKKEQFPLKQIRVEEFISTQLKPLLPYLFFEPNSAIIPERYAMLSHSDIANFSLNQTAHSSTIDVYYQLLNVIGKRMSENSTAILKLTGCNADVAEEHGQKSLSTKRAEAVKNYLVSVWNIPSNRIKTESRNLPANASRTADADVSASDAENRRVEFSSDNASILAPITSRDTIRNVYPPTIRITINSDKKWDSHFESRGKSLANSISNSPTTEWNITNYAREFGDSIQISNSSETMVSQRTFPVELLTLQRKREEQRADKTLDKYSLIVFDFDRSDLSPQNKTIAGIVKNALTSQSRVSITGTTDQLGDATYNRKLSLDRARATAAALGLSTAELIGEGESEVFPNSLPEGRFYNRTVVITVETPQ